MQCAGAAVRCKHNGTRTAWAGEHHLLVALMWLVPDRRIEKTLRQAA